MSGRALTSGEINLAKSIFKGSLDYNKVKIHNDKYLFFQPSNSGMTPNGELYIDGVYKKDYSTQGAALKGFFIHEMVHVWQYQLNILDPVAAAIWESITNFFDYSKAYHYKLDASKDILDYNIEQQAAIIEDYYRIFKEGLMPVPGRVENTTAYTVYKPLYQKVLAKFIANPVYAKHEIVCKKQIHGKPSERHVVCRRVQI